MTRNVAIYRTDLAMFFFEIGRINLTISFFINSPPSFLRSFLCFPRIGLLCQLYIYGPFDDGS